VFWAAKLPDIYSCTAKTTRNGSFRSYVSLDQAIWTKQLCWRISLCIYGTTKLVDLRIHWSNEVARAHRSALSVISTVLRNLLEATHASQPFLAPTEMRWSHDPIVCIGHRSLLSSGHCCTVLHKESETAYLKTNSHIPSDGSLWDHQFPSTPIFCSISGWIQRAGGFQRRLNLGDFTVRTTNSHCRMPFLVSSNSVDTVLEVELRPVAVHQTPSIWCHRDPRNVELLTAKGRWMKCICMGRRYQDAVSEGR
jgi:hypothetical protein